MTIADRRVTVLSAEADPPLDANRQRRLSHFRDAGAYVLLGDPGLGKTTAFREEVCHAEDAGLLTARDFLALPPGSGDQARQTLFLDGLDEVRVAAEDPRRPFDRLRKRLARLDRPRFRLSCRPLEWLGDDDRRRLSTLSPDGAVTVLCLEPLGDDEITAFLRDRSGSADTASFLEDARERRLDDLLRNPLTLGFLTEAAAAGRAWPESRRATFEQACRELVVERNREHRLPPASPREPPVLLEAAGDLCARLLLGGAAGFSLPPENGDAEYPALDADSADRRGVHREALASRVFTGGPSDRIVPAHRQIAEYLAARFLARRLEDGLPRRRVLALLFGTDGVPPTSLRGLVAWLAALSPPLRARLIEADPYAVAQYGDLGAFSLSERTDLFHAIRDRPAALAADIHSGLADRCLTGPDLLSAVLELLRREPGRESDESALQFLLPSLSDALPDDLAEELLRTSQDPSRPPETRWLAAQAFVGSVPPDRDETLLSLLAQIRSGEIPDSRDHLLGQLLERLYPSRIAPSEVWDYLPKPGLGAASGAWSFWCTGLLEHSTSAQVAEILDALGQRRPGLRLDRDGRLLGDLPGRLLSRGLEECGDEIGTARLCAWLVVAADGSPEADRQRQAVGQTIRDELERAVGSRDSDRKEPPASADRISAWFADRPDHQRSVLKAVWTSGEDSDDIVARIAEAKRLLYEALPPDYGKLCLGRAESWAETRPNLARGLLGEAAGACAWGVGSEDLSADFLLARAAESPRLAEWLPPLLRTDLPEGHFRRRERVLRAMAAPEPGAEEWLTQVRKYRAEIRENRAPPALLFDLAAALSRPGPDPERRFRGDAELLRAARAAIRGTPTRDDLPSFSEIARLPERRRRDEPSPTPWFAPAFLEAAREAADSAPAGVPDWSDENLRQLLAFHYAAPSRAPDLAHRVAAARPALAAEVLVEVVRNELATGGAPTDPCYDLAAREEFRETARLALPPLLRLFPTRASKAQLPALEWLLRAAVRHLDPKPLGSLLAKKAKNRTLNPAQRACWLTAGLGVAPGDFRRPLSEFFDAEPDRAGEVAEFLFPALPFPDPPESPSVISNDAVLPETPAWPEGANSKGWGHPVISPDAAPETLSLLIRALGRLVRPGEWSTGLLFTVGVRERTEWALEEWIARLARDPAPEAGAALDALVADEVLEAWREQLETARERRRPLARDAAFRHPTPDQLRTALANGPPANAADLAATVADRLREVADDLRGGDANPWRLFWNEVGIGRLPAEPKHEDSCRDALLSLLRPRLPRGVKAWPEGRYADDRRADLRLTYGDFAVPVEIKKNAHRQVWSAAWRQLAPKYATDPASDGYAIYLVLWFGVELSPPPLEGRRAETPEEMEDRLRADLRDRLPASAAQRIIVRVLDVRRPRAIEADLPEPAFGMVAEPRAPYRLRRSERLDE